MISGLYQTAIEYALNADSRHLDWCNVFGKMAGRVYNMNFGRQTGKTHAIVKTVHDNVFNYNSIVIAKTNSRLNEIQRQIDVLRVPYETNYEFGIERNQLKKTIFLTEKTLDALGTDLRGMLLTKKVLVFIDEPMGEANKVVQKLHEVLCMRANTHDFYFFVMGQQY